MTAPEGAVHLRGASSGDAADDLALAQRLLHSVAATDGRLVRTYRPAPTAAFSRRETHLPGFDRAVSAAAAAGFAPVVRPTGGRAVVYDAGSLVVDVLEPAEPHRGHREAYAAVTGAIAAGLRSLGVAAAVGPVPGEYCPGDFSIGARGAVKLAGVAQRATRSARLVGVVLTVLPSPAAVEVLTEVNAELGLEWDPRTCGSVSDELGGAAPADLEQRLVDALTPGAAVAEWHRWRRRAGAPVHLLL